MSENPRETDIRVKTEHYPGYGSAPTWVVRAVDWANNRELETQRASSEHAAGRAEVKLEAAWLRDWTPSDIRDLILTKPLASPWCTRCGGHTLDGGSLSGDANFCVRCVAAGAVEEERQRLASRSQVRQAELAATQRAQTEQRREDAEAAQRGFHWRDGWFWSRLSDGTVRVAFVERAPEHLGIPHWVRTDLHIPANEWASIVASVSVYGERDGRWQQALDFHNTTPTTEPAHAR